MSTPWVTLTVDDVKSAMTVKEINDFGKVGTDNDVDDRMAPTITNLVAEIRDMIGTWSTNTLSADASLIPPSFKARALSIARWRILITMPGYQPGDARKLDFEKADTWLGQVAKGQIRPQPAPDAVPNEVPPEQPSGVEFTAPGSRTGRSRMNGI